GIVHAYRLPPCSMYAESRTRSYVARSIGPVSGDRPPSPKRYTLERSASDTGTFGSVAAFASKVFRSASGTVQDTGSERPPCGGMRSPMSTRFLSRENEERPTLRESADSHKHGAGIDRRLETKLRVGQSPMSGQ